MCCSVLQCDAVYALAVNTEGMMCCSVLQYVAVCDTVCVAVCVAECYSVLQSVSTQRGGV